MRKVIALCALLLMMVGGCSIANDQVNPYIPELGDLSLTGAVGSCIWGMTADELIAAELSSYEYSVNDSGTRISVSDAMFLGQAAEVEFSLLEAYGSSEPVFLEMRIMFQVDAPELDVKSLSEEVSEMLGQIETSGYTAKGTEYELEESSQYWHAPLSLSDLLSDAQKQEVVASTALEDIPSSLSEEEFLDFLLKSKYPWKVQFIESGQELWLSVNGDSSVYLNSLGVDF